MRDFIKGALQGTGLFPVARAAYRKINPKIRRQKLKELNFYRSILPNAGLCFDVGANLGQRTEVFLGLNQNVVLVEPNSQCRPTLMKSFASNPKVEIVFQAVGAVEGAVDLYIHGTDSTASVLPGWDRRVFGIDRSLVKSAVPMTTLDALIGKYGIPDFIKIDVEGFEIEVIKGLSRKLALISFEYHPGTLDKAKECMELLEQLGKCTFRASDMECDWVTAATGDIDSCLREIAMAKTAGDLFVWII